MQTFVIARDRKRPPQFPSHAQRKWIKTLSIIFRNQRALRFYCTRNSPEQVFMCLQHEFGNAFLETQSICSLKQSTYIFWNKKVQYWALLCLLPTVIVICWRGTCLKDMTIIRKQIICGRSTEATTRNKTVLDQRICCRLYS